MKKYYDVIVPDFYEKFQCIGGECETTCFENYFVCLMYYSFLSVKKSKHELTPFESAFSFAEQYAKLKLLICLNADDYGGINETLCF